MLKTDFKQGSRIMIWVTLLIPIFMMVKCVISEEVTLMIINSFEETVKLDGCSLNGEVLKGCSIEIKAGDSTFVLPEGSTYPDENELKLQVTVSGYAKEYKCQLHKVSRSCTSEIGISKQGLFCGDCLSIY